MATKTSPELIPEMMIKRESFREAGRSTSHGVYVFLFTAAGKLVCYGSPGKDGDLILPGVDPDKLIMEKSFVYLCAYPKDAGDPGKATLNEMKQYNATKINLKRKNGGFILPGDSIDTFRELMKFQCRIVGHVRRIYQDNSILPVYKATVHIEEVDKLRLLIPKLPPRVIYWWRWKWLHELDMKGIIHFREPIPHDYPQHLPPDLDPVFTPKTINENLAEVFSGFMKRTSTGIQTMSMKIMDANLNTAFNARTGLSNDKLAGMLRGMQSNDFKANVKAILMDLEYWYPYFCQWKWMWPYLFTTTRIADAITDKTGRFEAYYHRTSDDWDPDVYVWVEYNGMTVYKPCIGLHTDWDYKSNSNIIVNLYDPRVHGYTEGPAKITGTGIEFMRIRKTPVTKIKQEGTTHICGKMFDKRGLIETDRLRPFGGTLGFKMIPSMHLIQSGAKYFRWTYQMLARSTNNHGHKPDVDLSLVDVSSAKPEYINDPVYIPYMDYDPVSGMMTYVKFPIGPVAESTEATYLIPHNDLIHVPQGHELIWTLEEFYMTLFETTQVVEPGLYEFKMVLLDKDMQPFYMDKNNFLVPQEMNPGLSEHASNMMLNLKDGDNTEACGFKIMLRIDNENMKIDLKQPRVINPNQTPETATDECGVLLYTDAAPGQSQVEIQFVASHPNDFGEFSIEVTRGNDNPTTLTANGYCADDNPGEYSLGTGEDRLYQKKINVGDALGKCINAAFVAILIGNAWATDGEHDLTQFNRSDKTAFMLMKKP